MPFHISRLVPPLLGALRYIKRYLFFEASPHSREINSFLNDGIKIKAPSVKERMDVLKEHVVSLVNLKGEFIGVRESRKHIAWYIKSLKDSASMRNLVCKIESFDELIKTLDEYTEFLCNEE